MRLNLSEIKSLSNRSTEPKPDIAICEECGWEGPIHECETGEDGDWESGYYTVDLCPKCEDGGCISYSMSDECIEEWEAWEKRRSDER